MTSIQNVYNFPTNKKSPYSLKVSTEKNNNLNSEIATKCLQIVLLLITGRSWRITT